MVQSKSKPKIYERYFGIYLSTLARQFSEVHLYEPLAGYGGDKFFHGSFDINIRIISRLYAQEGLRPGHIKCYINHRDLQTCEKLLKRYKSPRRAEWLFVFNKERQTFIDSHVAYKDRFTPALWLVDPYAYSEMSQEDLAHIINNGPNDIIIFIPNQFFKSFWGGQSEAAAATIKKLLGDCQLSEETLRQRLSIHNCLKTISQGMRLVQPELIVQSYTSSPNTRGWKNDFSLLFVSKNLQGGESFLAARRALFRQLHNDLFSGDEPLNLSTTAVKDYLSRKVCDNVELYAWSIRNGLLATELNEILAWLIEHEGLRRRSYYENIAVPGDPYMNHLGYQDYRKDNRQLRFGFSTS